VTAVDTDALFEPDGDRFVPTDFARGPWDSEALHGGPSCGLAAHVAESVAGDDFEVLRLDVDLVRPVPMRPLRVSTEEIAGGRRLRRVRLAFTTDGPELAYAHALLVRRDERGDSRRAHVVTGDAGAPPLPPADALLHESAWMDMTRFHADALQYRPVVGDPWGPGPVLAWLRLRCAVVAGTKLTGLARLAACSDMTSGLGWDISPRGDYCINTDVTIRVARVPHGEWIGLDARSMIAASGNGSVRATALDVHGAVGSIESTLVLNGPPGWRPEHVKTEER
jgi:hypothetical protein